jgi:hypothetical protein
MIRAQTRLVLVVLAAAVAVFCLPLAEAQAAQPGHNVAKAKVAAVAITAPSLKNHLQFAAVALGRENYFTPDQARGTRQRIDGAGFQGARVVVIWNGGSSPPSYDLDAVCNAAQASAGHKVFMPNLRPDKNGWPSDAASLKAYTDTLAAFDTKIFTGTGSNGQPCWPAATPPQQFMWMIGNEANSHDFCNGDQSTNDLLEIHKVCALRNAMLLHSSYVFLKGKNGEEGKYGRSILVVGGGLSSHDAPFDLLTKFLQDRKNLGYTGCDMDDFGFHPYSLNATDIYSGLALEPRVEAMLKAAGCPLKIIYTEMGVETAIPGGPGYNYNGVSNCAKPASGGQPATPGALCVPEDQIPTVYKRFIQIMQSQPDVIGFMNFELDDEQYYSGWQSGFYYFSHYPKSFISATKALFDNLNAVPAQPTVPPTRLR